MTQERAIQQIVAGMQNIERTLIDELRRAGVNITPQHLQWHRGQGLIPIPSGPIELEVRFGERSAAAVLSREQIEDSWDRVDRSDVVALLREFVTKLIG